MTSLMYRKLELLFCYIFPWWQPELTRRVCHFDVANGPFKCHFGALMWLHGTLKKSSWTFVESCVDFEVAHLLPYGRFLS